MKKSNSESWSGECECRSWSMDPMDPSGLKNGHHPLCKKSVVLHVFRNNAVDWFIAETIEEAKSMYRRFCKNTGVEEDDMDSDFSECKDDLVIKILTDDTDSSAVSKTCAQWCASNGKGFLCTENF